MFKFFSKVLLLIFLYLNFFLLSKIEAKSYMKFSKKYIPENNPGGVNFYKDEDFADSYRLYEKRREILKKKKLQSYINSKIERQNLNKKLEQKKIAILNNYKINNRVCRIDEEYINNDMINRYGINIARLKGALFIDRIQYEEVPRLKKNKIIQKTKILKKMQKKEIFPINFTLNSNPLKKINTCNSIFTKNKIINHSLNGSYSFRSISDTTK